MFPRPFAYRPEPLPDELLSSWIGRTARGLFFKPYAFVHSYWRSDPPVLTRDIDNMADEGIIAGMAYGTQTPLHQAESTTLPAYQGYLVERYNVHGRTAWILPIGVRHRERRHYGQQFCPQCLADDEQPYFRRAWRLGLFAACTRHGVVLADRCPSCTSALMPHRADELHQCWRCRYDLRSTPTTPASLSVLDLHRCCERALTRGWTTLGGKVVNYAPHYFAVLRQVMKLLAVGTRADRLRLIVADWLGIASTPFTFLGLPYELEYLDSKDRHRLCCLATALMRDWPTTFVSAAREAGLWQSWALKDLSEAPFIYASAVADHLQQSTYSPSLEEVRAAARYLDRTGSRVTKRGLRRLVGDSQVIHAVMQEFGGSPEMPQKAAERSACQLRRPLPNHRTLLAAEYPVRTRTPSSRLGNHQRLPPETSQSPS